MISAGSGMINMNRGDARVFARTEAQYKEVLPLAPDHFPTVRLSAAAAHEYELVALALLENALDRARKDRIYGGADDSWRDIGAMHGYKRFTKIEGQTQHYRVQGIVRAPMTNVMSLLYAERNSSIVERRKVFYGNAVDGQTLHVLRERTQADRHQHLTLRWEALNIVTATDTYKFDMSFLEYTGITLDKDRQPAGFKIAHSMDIPQCQSLFKSHGLSRLEGTEVMMLRPTSTNNYTEVTLEGSFEVDKRLPSTAIACYLTQIAQHLGRVPVEIQARRLAEMKIIDKNMWIPSNERKNCSVCLSRFGVLGKKHHCRSCGEVICKSCVVTRPHHEEDKFCKKCVLVACAEDELVIPDRNPLHTPSSQSSGSSRLHESRDSYASSHHRYSEPERLSASVFLPQPYHSAKPAVSGRSQYHTQHDLKLVEDLKHVREDNYSMTASETSYGSTVSSSGGYIDGSMSYYDNGDHYRPRPEDSMIYLDTKTMKRVQSNHSLKDTNDDIHFGSGRGYGRSQMQTPTMEEVEMSLAHQRHLLKEMMQQANRSYRNNHPAQARYY